MLSMFCDGKKFWCRVVASMLLKWGNFQFFPQIIAMIKFDVADIKANVSSWWSYAAIFHTKGCFNRAHISRARESWKNINSILIKISIRIWFIGVGDKNCEKCEGWETKEREHMTKNDDPREKYNNHKHKSFIFQI